LDRTASVAFAVYLQRRAEGGREREREGERGEGGDLWGNVFHMCTNSTGVPMGEERDRERGEK
jgi:hypothetical protein